jgi:hypothetical protein
VTITEARAELEAAIAAGGLRVAPPAAGRLALPAVVVTGGEPWLAPAQLGAGRYQLALEAVGLVGGASDPIVMADLERMALQLAAIVNAHVPPWTFPVIHRPGRTEAGGQLYTSVRVGTSRIIDT